jgi:hypothetical protein
VAIYNNVDVMPSISTAFSHLEFFEKTYFGCSSTSLSEKIMV